MRSTYITSVLPGVLRLALSLPTETTPAPRDARSPHGHCGLEATHPENLPHMHMPCPDRRSAASEPEDPTVTVTTTTTRTAVAVGTATANPNGHSTKLTPAMTAATAEHVEGAVSTRTGGPTGAQEGEGEQAPLLTDMTTADVLGLLEGLVDAFIRGAASRATSLIEDGTADVIGNGSAPAAQAEKAVVGLINIAADTADDLVLGVLDQVIAAIEGDLDVGGQEDGTAVLGGDGE